MPSLSKLSDECKKCTHVEYCDEKRMVACALIEMPETKMATMSVSPIAAPALAPIFKKHTPITINMGEYVKTLIGEENTLDPMRRDYRGIELDYVDEIVNGDKADINKCDFVLVYYDKPSVGTSMEILYTFERDIPVIVVTDKDKKLSPWLVYHSTVFYSFKDAIEHINNNMGCDLSQERGLK
jgi:hypothetical protein